MKEEEFTTETFEFKALTITIDPEALWWLDHGWDEFQEENK
jgi:hypothetical protein